MFCCGLPLVDLTRSFKFTLLEMRMLLAMGLLPLKIASCACAGNAGNVIFRHRGLAIPTCITARAWRTCRDACRDHYLADAFEVGVGENVPGIPGACATRNFTYLVRGPWGHYTIPSFPMSRQVWKRFPLYWPLLDNALDTSRFPTQRAIDADPRYLPWCLLEKAVDQNV